MDALSYDIQAAAHTGHKGQASPVKNAHRAIVEHYQYTQTLDINEVLSIKSLKPESQCSVIEKELTYKDSQGQKHELIYEAVSSGCQNG